MNIYEVTYYTTASDSDESPKIIYGVADNIVIAGELASRYLEDGSILPVYIQGIAKVAQCDFRGH